jgi:hypothetical protein
MFFQHVGFAAANDPAASPESDQPDAAAGQQPDIEERPKRLRQTAGNGRAQHQRLARDAGEYYILKLTLTDKSIATPAQAGVA